MIEGALITGGICISYWIDFGMSFCSSSISWRFPIAFQIVFALVILAFVLELPESPRWLILKVCLIGSSPLMCLYLMNIRAKKTRD